MYELKLWNYARTYKKTAKFLKMNRLIDSFLR